MPPCQSASAALCQHKPAVVTAGCLVQHQPSWVSARSVSENCTRVVRMVLQFREVFLTPDYLGIAMEYAAGGDMFQHVTNKRGLSEDEARWFFQQLILGLDYCHKMVRGPWKYLLVQLQHPLHAEACRAS
jgi:serine/threonine protein kinase